jgi:hypothetical protein
MNTENCIDLLQIFHETLRCIYLPIQTVLDSILDSIFDYTDTFFCWVSSVSLENIAIVPKISLISSFYMKFTIHNNPPIQLYIIHFEFSDLNQKSDVITKKKKVLISLSLRMLKYDLQGIYIDSALKTLLRGVRSC